MVHETVILQSRQAKRTPAQDSINELPIIWKWIPQSFP